MNAVDILKNPLPMIALAATISLGIFILSERFEGRKPRYTRNPRNTHVSLKRFIQRCTPLSRRIVFMLALGWVVLVYGYASYSFSELSPSVTFMTRIYGLSALFGLFLVLIIGLLRVYFPKLAINALLMHASRGFGLSVFLFVCLHAVCAFYANLDGKVNAVLFLSPRHQIALLFSSLAFVILFLMASTSIDKIIDLMTFPRWKKLHRLVHLAVISVLFHAFLIGSHFTVIAAPLPLIIIGTALTLLFLEAGAIYKKVAQASQTSNKNGKLHLERVSAALVLLLCAGMFTATMALRSSYDPHAGHSMTYSEDYAIEVVTSPVQFGAGETVQLRIVIKDKQTQQPWGQYSVVNEKLLHLIAISEDMQQYEHLHPEYVGNGEFSVEYTPPIESTYYLYAEFAPNATTEALARSVIATKAAPAVGTVAKLTEQARVQQSGQYIVDLDADQKLYANKTYKLSFQVRDSVSGTAVTSFEPYLGVMGHLAIVHEDKETYLHVHPTSAFSRSDSDSATGRSIDFSAQFPKPGMYRMYLQFQREGRLQTAAYTVLVQ